MKLVSHTDISGSRRELDDVKSKLARARGVRLRPEVAHAWQRAHISGLDPGMRIREPQIVDVDKRSRLVQAALPVLDQMVAELSGTDFSILLADRDCAIVQRRLGRRRMLKPMDAVMAFPGVRYVEDVAGPNSLGTAYELHEPIGLTGEEHYLEALKGSCCYGAPVIDPGTRRLEGVLDVTGPAGAYTALLGPFVRRAAREIELRLFESARSSERHLLATFHAHARRKRHAVVVLSPSVVLSNPLAADVVSGEDHVRLRALTDGLGDLNTIVRPLTLSSGSQVVVRAQAIKGTEGVLYEVVPRRSVTDSSTPRPRPQPAADALTLVVGEPGTGRSRLATELAGPDAQHLNCVDSLRDTAWLGATLTLLDGGTGRPVILDDVHVLDRRDAAALTPALRHTRVPVIMTSSPIDDCDPEMAALASVALERRQLRPLRHYGAEFPDVVGSVLRDLFGAHSLRIAPSTMRTLITQPWPGNIAELRAVLAASARQRRVGEIVPADLPDYLATGAEARNLTPLEAAERDAILQVLADTSGNKSAAATQLGIGRTTLYHRLRYFKIER